MPTYEYECTKCGEQFDYLQSIKEAPKDTCEKCGGALTKLLSAGTGLIFKGSGFYITDYKTKSGGEGSGKGASAKEGGGGGKTEGGGSQSTGRDSKSGQESKSSGESKVAAPAPSSSKSTGSSSSGKSGD